MPKLPVPVTVAGSVAIGDVTRVEHRGNGWRGIDGNRHRDEAVSGAQVSASCPQNRNRALIDAVGRAFGHGDP